jgi:hypothetical protein
MHEIKQLFSDSLRIILNSVLPKYSQNTLRLLHPVTAHAALRKWMHYTITQEVLGRTNRLLPFDTTRTHRKRRLQQFFVVACILCRGNVFTEPLPSNDRTIHISTHRLIGGIYEVQRWDGLVHTKFQKDWFRGGRIHRQTALRSHKHTLRE